MQFSEESVPQEEITTINFSPALRSSLSSITSWAKFLGIFGVVVSCVMIVVAIIMMVAMPAMGPFSQMFPGGVGILMGFIYLFMSALYLIPSVLLIKFSGNVKSAMEVNNQLLMEKGMGHLKNCFLFMGVMAIVVISFYILGFFAAIIGAAL